MELGGGEGAIARSLLATELECRRYVLTDLSEYRVRRAVNSIDDPRIEAQTLDIESSSFDGVNGETFDCVIMVALIEHLIDPILAMKNVRDKLKPGGFVYVNTPNIAKWPRRARLMLGQFPSTGGNKEGLRTYGGDPVTILDGGHFHYFTFHAFSKLLTEYCGYSKCQKLPYWAGKRLMPKPLEAALAAAWPEMFSELSLIAYK